jgi:hypothetical protein
MAQYLKNLSQIEILETMLNMISLIGMDPIKLFKLISIVKQFKSGKHNKNIILKKILPARMPIFNLIEVLFAYLGAYITNEALKYNKGSGLDQRKFEEKFYRKKRFRHI